jgi:hypothetical protein
MSVTARLIYDPSAASSSHSVGSYVLAGDDGTQIGHVSDALKVSLTNATLAVTQSTSPWVVSATDFDIRDLTHVSDSVKIGDGTDFLAIDNNGYITVNQGTSPWIVGDGGGSLTVDAVNLDVRDLTHASDSIRLGDGTSLITSTLSGGKQALDVYIANAGSIDIDDSLANTAIANATRAVSTTAIDLVASPLASRKWLYAANNGNKGVFIGASGVTAANGFPLFPGMQIELRVGASVDVEVIGEAGASSEDIRTMELS